MGGAPCRSYGPLGLPGLMPPCTARDICRECLQSECSSTRALIAPAHLTQALTSLVRNEINLIIQQYGFYYEKGKENTLAFTENPRSQSLCHNLNVSKKSRG